jgi:hypothetical protein
MAAIRSGAGSSRLDDSVAAGQAAAEEAVKALGGEEPALVVVYASMRYDLNDLLAGIRGITGEAPLVGATTSGHFLDGEMVPPGQGVSVLALSSGPYRFGTASATGLRDRPFALGQDLVRAARSELGADRPRYGALMVLADGFGGDLQSLLNGIYQIAGATVPVVGGAAGADRQMNKTLVFHGDRVLDDAAVAVWIGSERPLRVAFGHGWQAHGLPMLVTRVDGPVVHEIAGRPAFDVYAESFRTADTPEDAGVEWWQGIDARRAFGLIEPDGTEIIRGSFVDADGRPRTFTPLPPYSAIRIMTATPDDILGISEQVVSEAIGADEPNVLLTFSCVGRVEILQERAPEEARRLQEAAADVRTFGFYAYGEFARSTGVSGYHNATIAALAL